MGVEKKRIISGCGKPEGFHEDSGVAHLRWKACDVFDNGREAGHNQVQEQQEQRHQEDIRFSLTIL